MEVSWNIEETGETQQRRLVIVDNFDHPEHTTKNVTIQKNQVAFSGDQLVITGWKLIDEQSAPEQEEGGITEFLPKGTRYYLPPNNIKTWEDAEATGSRKKTRSKTRGKNCMANVFVSRNSIWTVDPEQPILEETVADYDCRRKLFFFIFGITCVVAALLISTAYTGMLAYSGGNVSQVTRKKIEPIHVEQIRKYYHLHVMIMSSSVFLNIGGSIILYRLFPTTSKFCIKCIHAFLGFIAAVGSAVGAYFSLKTHEWDQKDAPWKVDIHGTLGFLMIGLIHIQFWFGFIVFLLPCASFDVRLKLVPVHKFLGGITFIVGITTVATGTMVLTRVLIPLPEYTSRSIRSGFINSTGVLTVILGILVTVLVTDFRFRRRRRPEVRLVEEEAITMMVKAVADDINEESENNTVVD